MLVVLLLGLCAKKRKQTHANSHVYKMIPVDMTLVLDNRVK